MKHFLRFLLAAAAICGSMSCGDTLEAPDITIPDGKELHNQAAFGETVKGIHSGEQYWYGTESSPVDMSVITLYGDGCTFTLRVFTEDDDNRVAPGFYEIVPHPDSDGRGKYNSYKAGACMVDYMHYSPGSDVSVGGILSSGVMRVKRSEDIYTITLEGKSGREKDNPVKLQYSDKITYLTNVQIGESSVQWGTWPTLDKAIVMMTDYGETEFPGLYATTVEFDFGTSEYLNTSVTPKFNFFHTTPTLSSGSYTIPSYNGGTFDGYVSFTQNIWGRFSENFIEGTIIVEVSGDGFTFTFDDVMASGQSGTYILSGSYTGRVNRRDRTENWGPTPDNSGVGPLTVDGTTFDLLRLSEEESTLFGIVDRTRMDFVLDANTQEKKVDILISFKWEDGGTKSGTYTIVSAPEDSYYRPLEPWQCSGELSVRMNNGNYQSAILTSGTITLTEGPDGTMSLMFDKVTAENETQDLSFVLSGGYTGWWHAYRSPW